jgi:uracil-DNA glycosylase family 4
MSARPAKREEARFREIFRKAHANHPACLADEWLMEPCRDARGRVVPALVWSRRNGPWRQSAVMFVGAAPGNAGGKGKGDMGAHGTRIPFGGDVAGANLEVLLGSAGLTRNDVFITAAYNRLPARGGGEPTPAEIRQRVGEHPSSIHLVRDTIIAVGASLIVALGNVGLRSVVAAAAIGIGLRLPGISRLQARGAVRGRLSTFDSLASADDHFRTAWQSAWGDMPFPHVLWLTHPSAQNMSPFARRDTLFHQRLLEARDALRGAVHTRLNKELPRERPPLPDTGIYALPEWRERIAPRLARFDALWRAQGV